ncbi:MAG: 5'-nucleotidase C-terminal domain-containing protein [Chitinophagaceae bacterium]
MPKRKNILLIVLLALLLSSNSFGQNIVVSHGGYRITKDTKKDSSVVNMLQVYKDSIHKTMNLVIGFSTDGLTKKQPESGLGNYLTDAMKEMATQTFNMPVDAAFINYGGVRSYIPKGEITVGKIFELMPFDNLIVLQQVAGDTLQSFLNHIASKNGWPISGITMEISGKNAVNVMINGKPLDVTKNYIIANSDYIANGGDDVKQLKLLPQINKGYLLRDALISYTKLQTEQGKSIDTKTEKRITYANQ